MTAVWIGLALSGMSVIVVPTLIVLIRGAMKWTRVETKLEQLVDDMKELVTNKDRVHLIIMEEIKTDRAATDRRLRWLEEHLWKGRP